MQYSIGNSIFGLLEYPSLAKGWSIEEKFLNLSQRGYNHLEGDFEGYDLKKLQKLAQEFSFDIGYIRFGIRSRNQMEQLIKEAMTAGASYLVVIAGYSYDSADESAESIGAYMEMAEKAGIPFYLETHRDSATQDLRRLGDIIRQLPSVQLMVDFSHLLVAGEIWEEGIDTYYDWLTPVISRAKGFHGRITNGQQVQIGIESIDDPSAQLFSRLWERGISSWKQSKSTGQPFRFTVELGPPPYAITVPNNQGQRVELHDRIEQGELLIQLFKKSWKQTD
jgi:sugar phosphate isomerase/epimerase